MAFAVGSGKKGLYIVETDARIRRGKLEAVEEGGALRAEDCGSSAGK